MVGHLGEHEQLVGAGLPQQPGQAGVIRSGEPTNCGSIRSRRKRSSCGVNVCAAVSSSVGSTVPGSTVRIRIWPNTKEAASRYARSSVSAATTITATHACGSGSCGEGRKARR